MTSAFALVACIEPGALEPQSLLLFESVRRFGGAVIGDAELHAFSPRPHGGLRASTCAHLEELGVVHHSSHLNRTGLTYGSANRVYAAAWAERHLEVDLLCVLDSDTLFLAEPTALLLGADDSFGARPVDTKGSCSVGPGDVFEPYWSELSRLAGVSVEEVGWLRTTVDGVRVRASYNGGLMVCRPELGVLGRAAELFGASVERGLTPRKEPIDFVTGTGRVDPNASRWWGSSQAVMSVALAALGHGVVELPSAYNVPIHLADRLPVPDRPVHVHYHSIWDELAQADAPSIAPLHARAEVSEWLVDAIDRHGHLRVTG